MGKANKGEKKETKTLEHLNGSTSQSSRSNPGGSHLQHNHQPRFLQMKWISNHVLGKSTSFYLTQL